MLNLIRSADLLTYTLHSHKAPHIISTSSSATTGLPPPSSPKHDARPQIHHRETARIPHHASRPNTAKTTAAMSIADVPPMYRHFYADESSPAVLDPPYAAFIGFVRNPPPS